MTLALILEKKISFGFDTLITPTTTTTRTFVVGPLARLCMMMQSCNLGIAKIASIAHKIALPPHLGTLVDLAKCVNVIRNNQ